MIDPTRIVQHFFHKQKGRKWKYDYFLSQSKFHKTVYGNKCTAYIGKQAINIGL